jgi:glucokinase
MIVLSGDIGGTNSRLAIARIEGVRVALDRVARYVNADYSDLEGILADFLGADRPCEACCLAVAGPTDGRTVKLTNLDWRIDADALAARFGFSLTMLVNDFAAVGWGLDCLPPELLRVLQPGTAVPGAPRVALGAGTGLGVSLCAWHEDHYRPLPSEGGHVGFAPVDEEQDRLLVYLRGIYGRVSVERILSGPGIVDLYRFHLLEAGRDDRSLIAAERPAAAISDAGLRHEDAEAARALRLFARIYGQTAGDLALAARTEGGVFLAGGIAPRLLPILEGGIFQAGFRAKGRFREWMAGVPVAVVLDPDIGLRGAARAAQRALQSL